jgi:hypothetical protein
MKVILIPIFKFIYALLLSAFHIPYNIILFIILLLWEFNINTVMQIMKCKVDYFTIPIFYPYPKMEYSNWSIEYKTSFHAVWDIK